MRTFISFIKEFRIPKKRELELAISSLSKKQFYIFIASIVVAIIAMVSLLAKINDAFMVSIPQRGGTVTEGIIGTPTLVNPVLAFSDADKDLTALVYGGLMRKSPDGNLIPDLAESYNVSPDGKVYTFVMRKEASFHDGKPVTANDVIFTIEKIKDPLIKSPRKIGWDGVQVEKKDENTVVFSLKQPFISFLDNTTIGILPIHIWGNISAPEFGLSPFNIKAIGSGPYKIESISKNEEGAPNEYKLKRFDDFISGKPHVKYLNIKSFPNEKDLLEDLKSNSIDQASGLSPENANVIEKSGYTIHTATLSRIFGLFLNSSKNKILGDKAILSAFDKAIDREEIVKEVLNGYGTTIKNPIPETISPTSKTVQSYNIEEAQRILDNAGWKIGSDGVRVSGGTKTITQTKKVGNKTVTQKVTVNAGLLTRLSFSVSTGNTPELKKTSEMIKSNLEKIGVEVTIKAYETGQLNQLIRARDYESLFFGQIINHESDLFSFWHSSQKNDPGLNIAMYSNKKIDDILESIQQTSDITSRNKKYTELKEEFDKDFPAILIYSPKYLYATLPELNNIKLDTLTIPSDRFMSVHTWYANTDHVWKIFNK